MCQKIVLQELQMPPAKRKIIFVLKELALKSRSNHIELRFFVNSFGHVDFYAKIFPMLYPPLENSTILP